MYLCVCVCIYIYIYIYICMYACMYVCMYVCIKHTIYAPESVVHLIANGEDSQALATYLAWDDLM